MRVAVEKMPGVTSAAVSLNDGEVVVALQEDNRFRLDRLREVVRDQGFTPREVTIRAWGVVERRGARLVFRTPEGEVVLEVAGEPDVVAALERHADETIVVRGEVDEETPGRLRITEVTPM